MPLHPLVVHAVVVLGSAGSPHRPGRTRRCRGGAGCCGGRWSCSPSSWPSRHWPRSRPARTCWPRGPSSAPIVEDHQEAGELLRNVALGYAVLSPRSPPGRSAVSPRWRPAGARRETRVRHRRSRVLLAVGAVGAARHAVSSPATPAPRPSGADPQPGPITSRWPLAGREQAAERLDPVGVGLARGRPPRRARTPARRCRGCSRAGSLGHLVEVGERLDEVLRLHVGEPERPDARGCR